MRLLQKFIKLMKNELPSQKKKRRFAWALDESKYLKLYEVKRLRNACRKARDQALKERKTTVVRDWFMIELFTDNRQKRDKEQNMLIEELYKQIGQLKVELDWLKKKSGLISEGESFAYRPEK